MCAGCDGTLQGVERTSHGPPRRRIRQQRVSGHTHFMIEYTYACMIMHTQSSTAGGVFDDRRCSEECAHREGCRLRGRGEEGDAYAKCDANGC
jgi:hypothetical protein